MRVMIVAEISCNHCQDYNTAVETIKAAKKAGADAVKLQAYTPDTMTIDCKNNHFQIKKGLWKGKTYYNLYKEAMTPWEWIPKLMEESKKEGLTCFVTPFDKTAVEFLEKHNNPIYKIASFEITDLKLIEEVAKTGKPIMLSTGAAELEDIIRAIQIIKSYNNNQITLLYCVSSYPTKESEVNLNTINSLKERNVDVGISDHSKGSSIPVIATAMGISVIEKHFILNKELKSHDNKFSLTPIEFKKMVKKVRKTEKLIGYTSIIPTPSGYNFRRSLFVIENIKKGDIITENNVKCIRPGKGLHPKFYDSVIGKPIKCDVERGTPLKEWMVSIE